jgi:hypothetical protein
LPRCHPQSGLQQCGSLVCAAPLLQQRDSGADGRGGGMHVLEEARRGLSDVPSGDKWGTLQLVLLFNGAIGLALLSGSLFVTGEFGSGVAFQAVFTALAHLAYCAWLLQLARAQDTRSGDLAAGACLVMNVLLLETAVLWGQFSGGLGVCLLNGGTAERFISVLAGILCFSHLCMTVLASVWREDLLNSGLPLHNLGSAEPGGAARRKPAGHHDHSTQGYQNVPAAPASTVSGQGGKGTIPGNRIGGSASPDRFVIDEEEGDAEL